MRVSQARLLLIPVALGALIVGCTASQTTSLPGGAGSLSSSKYIAPPTPRRPGSGVYAAFVKNFDGISLTQVRLSIDPPTSKHPSYVVIFPFHQRGKGGPHFVRPYYRKPILLTTYRANKDGTYDIGGTAKLGHDLATLRFWGILGPTSIQVLYHDGISEGTFKAWYVRPTRATDPPDISDDVRRPSTGATAPPLIGNWSVALGGPPQTGPYYCGDCDVPKNYSMNLNSTTVYSHAFPFVLNAFDVGFAGGLTYGQGSPSIPVSGDWIAYECNTYTPVKNCAIGDWQATTPTLGIDVYFPWPWQQLTFGSDSWEVPGGTTSSAGSWSITGDGGITNGSNSVTLTPN